MITHDSLTLRLNDSSNQRGIYVEELSELQREVFIHKNNLIFYNLYHYHINKSKTKITAASTQFNQMSCCNRDSKYAARCSDKSFESLGLETLDIFSLLPTVLDSKLICF